MPNLPQTTLDELQSTISSLAASGKGLLAADESTPTITKRFTSLNISCTEDTRKAYRELLLTSPHIEKYIAGVILYEETLMQKTSSGISFPELLIQKGILPGIKVDKGLVPIPGSQTESVTQGLDGLADRLIEYKKLGARFAKWRAVYSITKDLPSMLAIHNNADTLARYAAICQAAGIVPIVEPEVLIEGDHTLETCFSVSEKVLHRVFQALFLNKVLLEYIVLKPSMVIPGKECSQSVNPEDIAKATMTVLLRTVPAAVPTINFLSGGQTPQQATLNLNAMHQHSQKNIPWNLSFSYARALQEPTMKRWQGNVDNIAAAQQLFSDRAKMNSLASLGKYHSQEEANVG